MVKINFTKEHFDEMKSLAVEMLLKNEVVTTKMGQVLNIVELLHTTTISTLNSIRLNLAKKIEDAENKDEWIAAPADSKYLTMVRNQKRLVNLIIGWKRYLMEVEQTKHERSVLEAQLKQLKESQKTPEEKIKELESKLSALESTEF